MGWNDARIKGPRPGNHPFKAVDEHSFMTHIKNQYPGIGSRITEGHMDTVAKDQAHEALKSNALRGGLGLAAVGGGAKAFSKKSDD
jgi:hypothetical protein